ncbi:MAG TPA: AmmeMemoRadiSam system protein A [Thermoanaerobaculia bacterium]|nr:AmmeMemoRadiSam system protein A [Thermoanaerobaculia bacterium]
MLTETQRKQLLQIARSSIAAVLDGRQPELDEASIDDILRKPAGAFVTLKTKTDDLRGCIGSIHPVAPLFQAVSKSAVNAAFRDPRFYPLQRHEFDAIVMEISVMGPIVRCSTEEIVAGRDGLIITHGRNSGLLLPQVAAEYNWDREQFLKHTCLKAGLPADAWQNGACKLEKFEAEVFGE